MDETAMYVVPPSVMCLFIALRYFQLVISGGSMKDRAVPPECAIKVFKTSLNEFKRREEYMRGDHRLPSQGYKKHNPRKVGSSMRDRTDVLLIALEALFCVDQRFVHML